MISVRDIFYYLGNLTTDTRPGRDTSIASFLMKTFEDLDAFAPTST